MRTLVAESPAVLGRLWRHPALRTNLLLAVFATGAVMMNVPNSYGLALEVFDRGSLGLGALEVFVAVGLIVGGLVVQPDAACRATRMPTSSSRWWRWRSAFIAVSFSGLFWVSIVLMGLAGVASVGVFVSSITMFQETAGLRRTRGG